MKKQREIWDTNRTVSQKANNQGFWCKACDMCFIHTGQRCPECGVRCCRNKLKPTLAVRRCENPNG